MARNIARYTPRSDMMRPGMGMFPDMGNLLRQFSLAPVLRELEQAPRMKVDIEENDQSYILRADVPGANREDITVTLDGNTVAITMNVDQQQSGQSGNMLLNERIYGEEYRVFTLPQEVDESRSEARMENGILVLTLQKKTGTGAKKLDIQQQQQAGASGQAQSAAGGMQSAGGTASAQSASAEQSAASTGQGKPS